MNNDDVNVGTEQTDPDVSQTSEAESTGEDSPPEDSSSSEDVNTQSEESDDELVEGADAEVISDKGKNRVQELANDRNRLTEENKALRDTIDERKSQKRAEIQNQRGAIEPDKRSEVDIYMMRQELNDLKVQSMYQKAESDHPELDKRSEDYDQKFDDMVYRSWLVRSQEDPTTTPNDVANEFKNYFQTQRDEGAKRSENQRKIKKTVTTGRQTANTNDGDAKVLAEKQKKFAESGSIDDLTSIIDNY